jgi:hypothetical protein
MKWSTPEMPAEYTQLLLWKVGRLIDAEHVSTHLKEQDNANTVQD